MKGKSCLTNLIFFDDKVFCLVEKGKTVDVGCLVVGVFLHFLIIVLIFIILGFDTVYHRILLEKMSSTELNLHVI